MWISTTSSGAALLGQVRPASPKRSPVSTRRDDADLGTVQGNGSRTVWFHLKTLWLFTRNDLYSIVYPVTAFGIIGALSGQVITTNTSPQLLPILGRIPRLVIWIWLNVLVFDINNQRQPSSIHEDAVNKPYRPLPLKRLTTEQATRLLLHAVPVLMLASCYLGGMTEALAVMVMGWMYNDLGGSDDNFVFKNLLNALGIFSYNAGALRVACLPDGCVPNATAYQWLTVLGAIIATTVHVQDICDQAGDCARGRNTFPLVFGDRPARWTVAVLVLIWSFFCPAFWELGALGFMLPVALGGLIAFRTLRLRSVPADQRTWMLWSLWIFSLYLLPLWKNAPYLLPLWKSNLSFPWR